MTTLWTFEKEQELLGEPYQYPGHPIVIAAFIVSKYPSFDSACVQKGDYPACVGDINIPGAGGNVWQARAFLEWLHDGVSFEEVCQRADEWWARCDDMEKRGLDRFQAGQKQAEKVKPLLKKMLESWK